MTTAPTLQELIQQKLARFEQLEPEFEKSFQFVQNVHGQRRFPKFSINDIVRYLHALWICDKKAHLLSVPRTTKEYDGKHCLELLRQWQAKKDTVSVVEFLHYKLDMLPLVDLTRQIQEANLHPTDDGAAQRLMHGRIILLNRGINLMQALDALFTPSEKELFSQVCEACERYEHLPAQVVRQIEEMNAPIYTYMPHPLLAQRNMVVMNRMGVKVLQKPFDLPGQRSWRVSTPVEPLSPFAEQVVPGYLELTTPLHNNLRADRFVDQPEHSIQGVM